VDQKIVWYGSINLLSFGSAEGKYDAIIGELDLYLVQKILYLFDYGYFWQFAIQLMEIEEDELLPETPEMIEIKGEAPEQYESYDDFDEDKEYLGD
jgi:hypothetical protein